MRYMVLLESQSSSQMWWRVPSQKTPKTYHTLSRTIQSVCATISHVWNFISLPLLFPNLCLVFTTTKAEYVRQVHLSLQRYEVRFFVSGRKDPVAISRSVELNSLLQGRLDEKIRISFESPPSEIVFGIFESGKKNACWGRGVLSLSDPSFADSPQSCDFANNVSFKPYLSPDATIYEVLLVLFMCVLFSEKIKR